MIGVYKTNMDFFHNGHKKIIDEMVSKFESVVVFVNNSSFIADEIRKSFNEEYGDKVKLIFENSPTYKTTKEMIELLIRMGGETKTSYVDDTPWSPREGSTITKVIVHWADSIFAFYDFGDKDKFIEEWKKDLPANVEIHMKNKKNYMDRLSDEIIKRALFKNDIKFVRKYCPKSINYYLLDISNKLFDSGFTYEEPTKKQISYAESLGIDITPYKFNKDELSNAISVEKGEAIWIKKD